jgi:outer membrane protease
VEWSGNAPSLILAQLAFLASASGALAQTIDPKLSTSTTGAGWSADASIGVLYGKGQEFVYNPDGSTVSQLDWRSRPALRSDPSIG